MERDNVKRKKGISPASLKIAEGLKKEREEREDKRLPPDFLSTEIRRRFSSAKAEEKKNNLFHPVADGIENAA